MQSSSPRFSSQQFMLRNVLHEFIEICMEKFCPSPPEWAGFKMAAGNQQKHLPLRFATKT